jgi:hypothetical protein
VSTATQLTLLLRWTITNTVQGHYFSRVIAGEEAMVLLEAEAGRLANART